MTTLKLYGFTDQERESLQRKIPSDQWTVGRQEELDEQRPRNEVWIVSRTVVDEFRYAPFFVLIWIPEGQEPLSNTEWVGEFDAQLQEEREEDLKFLQKVTLCPKVLQWTGLVEDLKTDWFNSLTESPHKHLLAQLPFEENDKRHLWECNACCQEAYEQLHRRAMMHWMLCPSVADCGAWLRAGQQDQGLDLITHLTSCGLCRETVKRLVWLYSGATLLTRSQVAENVRAVPGLADFVPTSSIATSERVEAKKEKQPQPWLTATWHLVTGQVQSLAEAGAAMAEGMLSEDLPWAIGTVASRSVGGPGGRKTTFSMDELKKRIDFGVPVELTSESSDRWLALSMQKDRDSKECIVLQVGESPANRLTRFRVEFQQAGRPIVTVEAEEGIARLVMEDFNKAQQADLFVIIEIPEDNGKKAGEEIWRVLTEKERSEYRQIVRDQLARPDWTTAQQVITSLLHLAADELVNNAFQSYYANSGSKKPEHAEEHAAHMSTILRDEVRQLIDTQKGSLIELVENTADYWKEKRMKV